jgi:hypothetical protein
MKVRAKKAEGLSFDFPVSHLGNVATADQGEQPDSPKTQKRERMSRPKKPDTDEAYDESFAESFTKRR